MKKLLVLTLVFALLTVTFVPALAAGGGTTGNTGSTGNGNQGATGQGGSTSTTSGKQLYALAGYIKEIDDTNKTVTVDVLVGNRIVTPYITTDTTTGWITVKVTADTRLLLSGGTPILFSDLDVGDPVSSNGILSTDASGALVWTATRITKGALLINQ